MNAFWNAFWNPILGSPDPDWTGRFSLISVKRISVFAENSGRHDGNSIFIDCCPTAPIPSCDFIGWEGETIEWVARNSHCTWFVFGKLEIIVGVLTGKWEPYKNWSSASISHGQLPVIEDKIGEGGSSILVGRKGEVEPRWRNGNSFEWTVSGFGDNYSASFSGSSSISLESMQPDIFREYK